MSMQHTQQSNIKLNTLNQQSLSTLSADVDVPKYDRSKLTAGIVHIGVGGFHRAHQAMYINELLKMPGSESWAICGVGLLEANRSLRDVLVKQDYLYSLTVRHPNGQIDHQVIGSMIDFLFAPEDKQKVIDKLVSPQTKIVSLTITEGGYNFNPATGEFDFTNPEIIHDMANLHDPITAFGYITAALIQRKAMGMKPFTIQSCDNIQHNGDMTRKMLLAFVSKIDVELGQWIEANVAFPNAMVDRITPVTTKADIEHVANTLNINDEWPITCEAFTQWVIEDNFSDGRPALDSVGAQFVSDVTPFEKMKIRLLNAGHSVLGLLGSIHGFATIDESVTDPLFAKYLRQFMDDEVTPLIDQLEGIDLTQYKDTLIERFANPNIKDSLARICLESSAKLPKFIIASINENIALNRDTSLACLVIAAWCLYSDKQVNQQGEALEINDQMAVQLHEFASKTAQDPLAFLQLTDLFGDLNNQAVFCKDYRKAIADLYADNSNIKAIMQARLQAKG
ncbi:mannitol dehydrogenase family protein [Shewanella ulleungensis]|jgi:mannitol 2-dehydrogenase|uniref:mannitol dehydrogenase family protein n=1 Tax=Shewanella ulleungensis TaxID=2282699 RepID=UPI003D793D6A